MLQLKLLPLHGDLIAKVLSGNAEAATRGVLYKKDVLKNFATFEGKQLCKSLFFNKVVGLRPATLLKKDSGAGIFLWVFWNF